VLILNVVTLGALAAVALPVWRPATTAFRGQLDEAAAEGRIRDFGGVSQRRGALLNEI